MTFVRLSFKNVNGDERTHKVPGKVVSDYEVSLTGGWFSALTSYILKYLHREPHMDEVHIHTNSGPCQEDTLVYADNYNTGCFQCENAGEAIPLHVHLLPRNYIRVPIMASETTKPCYSADDLSIHAIKRITNNNDERLVVGRAHRSQAAVYAIMCRDDSVKYCQTDYDLSGRKCSDDKHRPIQAKKIKLFRNTTDGSIRKRLKGKKKIKMEKVLAELGAENAQRSGGGGDGQPSNPHAYTTRLRLRPQALAVLENDGSTIRPNASNSGPERETPDIVEHHLAGSE
ncbi:hypothetical protein SLS58_010053 [Diplodia intermedia]|uniref:Uncharacterized protein n=1 Tax=Diplodia intermedia TaxID=856260 RepID=A0ABR3T8L0_9PEZI